MNGDSITIEHGPIVASEVILSQIEDLLYQFDQADYQLSIKIIGGSSIGQHIRHIIDFYSCIFDAAFGDTISYDGRQRLVKLEEDPKYAIQCVNSLKLQLQLLDLAKPVTIEACFSSDVDEVPSKMNTSLGRELMYGIDHAIHHLAVVKIGIENSFDQISIEREMGVAPSTIKHRNK